MIPRATHLNGRTKSTLGPFNADLQAMLLAAVRGGTKVTDAHLRVIEKDVEIEGTLTRLHCYAPTLDGNGRLRIKRLAQFLRDRIISYAIPRPRLEKAQEYLNENNCPSEILKLQADAKNLFTKLKTSGEGGEFLLFALAEAVFEFTQILCKMSLKTASGVHYHGSDGVYAQCDDAGYLHVYWGESKVYGDAINAITDCLKSLAPFLRDEPAEDASSARDIFLINEFADFSDQNLIAALKRYFDDDDAMSNKLRYCGVALVGFDCKGFPAKGETGVWETIEPALKAALPNWSAHVGKRIVQEKLESFDIHFICVPMRSVDEFREYFLSLLETA
ncbi:DUF1837 domain-containing protein [Desulfolutivibrio sulfoxidireducens]|nr:DUF1837 domain-containing protein [Desulfolutivibrio sulfoxidireducens]